MQGIKNGQVKLILYFDEAHVLSAKTVPHDPDGKDMYDVLCSCFNLFLSLPVFVIFLSTVSNIYKLAPSGSLAKSARARANTDALQAPVTETPFDCSPKFPIKPGKFGLEEVSRVEFMAQFGRPMWVRTMHCKHFLHAAAHCRFWTLLAGAKRHKDQILPDIVDLARAKLICDSNISVPYTTVKHAAVTAVLDVLLTLDFEPRRQVAHIREAELVASHMRIAFSVPKDRGYIRSGYPSEPLLAEAAARQMHEFQKRTWRAMGL
jgi:hypothetical protein